MNPEYLFFAQFTIEQKNVSGSIYIALSKVHGQCLTASHLRSNTQTLQNLVFQDLAYLSLRQIQGHHPTGKSLCMRSLLWWHSNLVYDIVLR